MSKSKAKVGDELYEVEWVSKMAFYPDCNDVDHDRCESSYRNFKTFAEALAFANEIWPNTKDKLGIVEITLKRYESDEYGYCYWQYAEDPKIISDESGVPK